MMSPSWTGAESPVSEIDVHLAAFGVLVDPLHVHPRTGRHIGQAAGQSDHLVEALLSP